MQEQPLIERTVFGMPKPQGWTVERVAMIMAGAMILVTQIANPARSNRLRAFTGWVAANLILNGFAGWCPGSVLVHKLGVPAASERTLSDVGNRLAGTEER